MKNHLVALSFFCFAVCFLIGRWLAEGLSENAQAIDKWLQNVEATIVQ